MSILKKENHSKFPSPLPRVYEYDLQNDFRKLVDYISKKYNNDLAFILKEKVQDENTGKKNVKYRNITFSQFKDEVFALAAYLMKHKLNQAPVAVMGKNSYPWILTYMATLVTGAISVPLDKALPEGETLFSLERSHAGTLVYDGELNDLAEAADNHFGGKLNLISMVELAEVIEEGQTLIDEGFTEHLEKNIDPNELAVILFTSGTTSMSKAVMLSQRNILINSYDAITTEPIRSGDVNMAFLPYHHTFGSTGQIVMLYAGVTTTYCDGLKYIQKNLVEYKVSIFVGVPLLIESIYKKILAGVRKQNKEKKLAMGLVVSKHLRKIGIDKRRELFKDIIDELGGNLHFVITGASAIDPIVVEGLNGFGITTVQGYGLTESAPILCAESPKFRRTGSVGKAMPTVELDLVDVNKEGVGQLIARGPNIMAGYYENPDETAKALKDGWLYTGDLAKIDKDGFVFIKGREKNVIVLKNGKNVYPEELEVLISNLPFVEEVFVFGQEKGEDLSVSAKVVYKADYMQDNYGATSPEDIEKIVKSAIDKINDTMPVFKHIRRLVLTDQPMIKTTTGKVKRFEEVKTL